MLRLIALILVCTLLVLELVINKPKADEDSEGSLLTANVDSSGYDSSFSSQAIHLSVTEQTIREDWQEEDEFLTSFGFDFDQFDDAAAKKEWKNAQGQVSLLTLWSADQPVTIQFTYQSGDYQEQEVIELSLILQDTDDGQIYLSGACKAKGGVRTYAVSEIESKIDYAGKKYGVEEFIVERLSAELSAA